MPRFFPFLFRAMRMSKNPQTARQAWLSVQEGRRRFARQIGIVKFLRTCSPLFTRQLPCVSGLECSRGALMQVRSAM
jgi:hypothetical protein